MGCDIHAYVERLIDGEWHTLTPIRGEYSNGTNDGSGWGGMRDYDFFSQLCGVRGRTGGDDPEPRGMPPDVAAVTKWESDKWDCDGHSHSWESMNNFIDKKLAIVKIRGDENNKANGYSREYYEWKILNYEIPDDEPRNLYRVVFWFDN